MNLNFIPYTKEHFQACISIFKSNVPKYFEPKEEADLKDWLNGNRLKYYYVGVFQNNVVCCGGFVIFHEEKKACFAWGMVHSDYHQQGFGKALANFRLKQLNELAPEYIHELNTAQYTYQFFEKFGFEVKSMQPDGWFKGWDKYHMVRKK